jgi:hypothetical protein
MTKAINIDTRSSKNVECIQIPTLMTRKLESNQKDRVRKEEGVFEKQEKWRMRKQPNSKSPFQKRKEERKQK